MFSTKCLYCSQVINPKKQAKKKKKYKNSGTVSESVRPLSMSAGGVEYHLISVLYVCAGHPHAMYNRTTADVFGFY